MNNSPYLSAGEVAELLGKVQSGRTRTKTKSPASL